MNTLLQTRGLSAGYGGQPVVHDIEIEVREGEIVALLGANGAGKTTTLLTMAGELPTIAGEVLLDGKPTKAPLHRRARNGFGYITEERSVFMGLSARDNLRCGGVSPEKALELFPELERCMDTRGGLLSGGEQQMLTLARAIGRKPRLLLADELSMGLAPLVVDRLLKAVRSAADTGTAVLIVEQYARKALKYADRVYVMRGGRIEMDLSADQARGRLADIEAAYLSTAALASNGNVKPAAGGAA
ncbi:MAG: putative high-affinity branched-chain amino acid transport protein superfamily, atp bind [Solirubrobacterales bacterium]|jgi:branched-chain amino acid transport system ATP-binding protein|nr:putative high-affinity branched-chain amino acid transport protein superfamily, atp bind [Solirubrobacterales bacterium]